MSSVGPALGGIVGGAIGFFVGNPILGAQIGITLGGLLDPPKVQGPRLQDLSAQTSTYGAFIPRIYGTVAVTGNVLWIQGDRLIERSVESGGKGGPTVTNFEYFATFAVGLCEGPIDAVRRIWIGGQLWYDAGNSDINTIVASNEAAAGFTLYTGSETQLADPLIQADRGAANVPAYRGLAYIVFEELALKDVGNSLAGAQVKVEVVMSASESSLFVKRQELMLAGNTAPTSITGDGGRYLYVNGSFSGSKILSVLDAGNPDQLTTIANYAYVPGSPGKSSAVEHGGYVYIADPNAVLYVIDVSSKQSPVLLNTVTLGTTFGSTPQPYSVAVSYPWLYVTCRISNSFHVFDISNPLSVEQVNVIPIGVSPEYSVLGDGYVYVSCSSANTIDTVDVSIPWSPVLVSSVSGGDAPAGLDIWEGYLHVACLSARPRTYDLSTPSTPAFVHDLPNPGGTGNLVVTGDSIHAFSYGLTTVLNNYDARNPAAPVFSSSLPLRDYPLDVYTDGNTSYVISFSDGYVESFISRHGIIAPGTVALSSIVQSECLKSDLLTAADLDVTELTDQVRGYRVSSLAPLRGGIDPLRKAWPFDSIQHGYKIKFKKRGGASVATITEGELDAREAGATPGVRISNVREMDLVLPRQLTATYLDATREYDQNVAEESRE